MGYFIIDDCGTEYSYECTGAWNEENALKKFRAEWEKLTQHDRDRRKHFQLVEGEIIPPNDPCCESELFVNRIIFSFK